MIENYKELLYAIFNSDILTENKGNPIIVYDTKNNDLPVAVFKNATTCAKFFHTSDNNIRCYISRNALKLKRYRFERVDSYGRKTKVYDK